MIVPMKKLTLFLRESGRSQALLALRRLGAVHLKTVKQKNTPDLNEITAQLEKTDRAITILRQYAHGADRRKEERAVADARGKIDNTLKLHETLKADEQALEKISWQMDWYKPWGAFNPEDIRQLSNQGVYIKLYKISENEYKQVKDNTGLSVVSNVKGYLYIAHITRNADAKLAFTQIAIPEDSFDILCKKHTALKERVLNINASLQSEAYAFKYLQTYKHKLEKQQRFLRAMNGMGEEAGFSYVQGYVPRYRHDDIVKLAQENNAGYLLEDPDAIDDVPTLIKNPKWIEIISPVFKFMSTVPGYAEYDISGWFLLFFTLFFAMLVGDAGYGIIFLTGTFIARKRFKHLPGQPFFLMYILSSATIVWGAITGTWFGVEAIARLPFFSHLIIQGISSFAADNQNLMIFICFSIGIIHLTLAHIIVGLKILNSLKALAELGWILVLWALYFLAGTIIARPMPAFVLPVLALGVVLLLVFSEPQKNILKAVALSLTNIPLKIISSFADLVSYIRLFAVGCATVVLASTFNDIVLGIGFNSIISGLAAAIILFLGHALNIALAFMAVIVHGIRLNMLEFSGQMGMSWSGREYEPFKE